MVSHIRQCTDIKKASTDFILSEIELFNGNHAQGVYMTPGKCNKMKISDKSWHGCSNRGTLMHCLWECPAEILQVVVPKCPSLCILGDKDVQGK